MTQPIARAAAIAAVSASVLLCLPGVSRAESTEGGNKQDLTVNPLLMPNLPPLEETPVLSRPAVLAQATTSVSPMTLENCEVVQSPDNPDGRLGGQISPAGVLRQYWEAQQNEKFLIQNAKVSVLDGPMHGKIVAQWLSRFGGPTFAYDPDSGYLGQDKITFLVEVGGKSVKVETTLVVVEVAGLHESPCFTGVKRISSSSGDPRDVATSFAINQLAPT